MFDVFGEVKRHIKTSGYIQPRVTSGILHMMKLTMLATITSCVLVTARQYIGQNINCISGLSGQEHKAIENFCFISGTFTIKDINRESSAHPGVGPLLQDSEDNIMKHTYYQWVPIVLALQAALYYLPELIWKQVDRGFFETALCKLNMVHIEEQEAQKHITASAGYLSRTLRQHNHYARCFFLVETLSVFIAISNLFLTNAFLGGEFIRFGPAAIKYLHSPINDYNNPLNVVFPKMGKCVWHRFGPSGTIQKYDAMCLLPLNIVNEKTYVFIWICYMTAAVVTSIIFVYHTIIFFIPKARESLLLHLPMKKETRARLQHILKKSSFGDWFLIWNFKSNMAYFGDWVKTLDEMISA